MTTMGDLSEFVKALGEYKDHIERRVDLTATAGGHDRRTMQAGAAEGQARGKIMKWAKEWHGAAVQASNPGKTEERLKTEPKKRERKKLKEETDGETAGDEPTGAAAGVPEGSGSGE